MPTFKQLLRSAWDVYRARWPVYTGIAVVWFLVPVLLTILGLGSLAGPKALPAAGLASLGVLTVLLIIGAVIIGFWANLALIYSVKHRDWAEISSFRTSFKNTVKLIWPLIWTSALGLLAMIGALVPLILPVVILWVGLAFVSYVVALEERRGLNALLRSRQLVEGSFTYVFWRVFVLGILVGLLAQVIVWILIGAGAGEGVANLVNLALGLVLVPIVVAFMVLLYEQLAQAKPAEDFQEDASNRRRYQWLVGWGAVATVLFIAALAALVATFSSSFFSPGSGAILQGGADLPGLEKQLQPDSPFEF